MTYYARINPNDGTPDVRDFASTPPTAKGWKPLTIDAQPVPSASQVIVQNAITFAATTATQSWSLRAKTQEELDGEELHAERDQIATYLADIKTQLEITNAARGALTNAQRLNELEKDSRVTMRAVKYLLRRAKQQG